MLCKIVRLNSSLFIGTVEKRFSRAKAGGCFGVQWSVEPTTGAKLEPLVMRSCPFFLLQEVCECSTQGRLPAAIVPAAVSSDPVFCSCSGEFSRQSQSLACVPWWSRWCRIECWLHPPLTCLAISKHGPIAGRRAGGSGGLGWLTHL